MGDILVGTSSWTDKSLIASGWYPKGVNSAEERLRYYAEQYRLVEVDSTYYFPPTLENSERWVERTPAHFTFNIKAFSVLTGHPTKLNAIDKDLRPKSEKANLYPSDLPDEVVDEIWLRFKGNLSPLVKAKKLGVVLFQFPPWFTRTIANKEQILECVKRIAPLPVCIEFRHESWLNEKRRDDTLAFLAEHDLPYVVVDMPQGFKSSVPPIVETTSKSLSVVRFHGHNDAEWNSKSVQRRFAYDYSEEELKAWVPKIRNLSERTETTHVLMNNCHRDFAQRNASDLINLLGSE